MASENRKIDANYKASMAGVTNDASEEIRRLRVNPTTNRLLVENSALDSTLDSVAIDQKILLSTGNLSTGTLGYGSIYVGTPELTYNITTIQTFFKSDQRCILYCDQGSDGTTYELTDSWTIYENTADARAVYSVAPYFRIRVKNDSISSLPTTSTLLMTAMTPNMTVVPRTLDEHGHFCTAIEAIHGPFNKDVTVSPMGGLRVAEGIRLVGASFIGTTVDSNFWSAGSITGSGTISQANGNLTLFTGTTANSNMFVNSNRVGRYIAANPNYYRANLSLPTVATGTAGYINTRRWGAFDADNGYFFQAIQTNPATKPILSIVTRKTKVDTTVSSGSLNGLLGTYYTFDTDCHTYEIYWTNKNAYYIIDNDLIHTVTSSGTTAVDTPSLKIGLQNFNSGGNVDNNQFRVRSSTINRLGATATRPQWRYIAGAVGTILKYGPGTLHKIVCNKDLGTTITLLIII